MEACLIWSKMFDTSEIGHADLISKWKSFSFIYKGKLFEKNCFIIISSQFIKKLEFRINNNINIEKLFQIKLLVSLLLSYGDRKLNIH